MLIEKSTETGSDNNETIEVVETPVESPKADESIVTAATRAERIARFNANAAIRDQEENERKLKERLRSMTESEREIYLSDLAVNDRVSKMTLYRQNLRQNRQTIAEIDRTERERQRAVGIDYRERSEADAEAAFEAKK